MDLKEMIDHGMEVFCGVLGGISYQDSILKIIMFVDQL